MRWLIFFFALAAFAGAAVPPELAAALVHFRGDPPAGWSYTQTTSAQDKSTVERFDAAKPVFERWSLVQQDGHAPTADETRHYAEIRSRWSRTGTAPKITDQLDLDSVEAAGVTGDRATFRSRLRPGESGDKTAAFLRATIVVHTPTQTIESIELVSIGEFNPTVGVKIVEMKTRMTYALPAGETPALPQKVETRVRGKAFWVKSLDADLSVTYSGFTKAAAESDQRAEIRD